MRIASRLMIACLAASLVGHATAARAVEVVVGGYAGYGSYTQEHLNALIRYINGDTGVQSEIKAGAEFGGLVGVKLNDSALLGVAFSRLTLHSTGTSGPESSEVSAPADCWLVSFSWLPDNDKVGRIGLGADAGLAAAKGFIEFVPATSPVRRVDYEGKGLFLAGYVVADVQLGGRWGGYAHGGFRLVNVKADLNGEPPDDTLDYSGAFLRVGLRVSLGGDPR